MADFYLVPHGTVYVIIFKTILCPCVQYNPVFETALSVDKQGILEYWMGPKKDFCFPPVVSFKFKTDTDLYEFVKVRKEG